MSGTTVSNNTAGASGGGIYAEGSGTISGTSLITLNTATASDGSTYRMAGICIHGRFIHNFGLHQTGNIAHQTGTRDATGGGIYGTGSLAHEYRHFGQSGSFRRCERNGDRGRSAS